MGGTRYSISCQKDVAFARMFGLASYICFRLPQSQQSLKVCFSAFLRNTESTVAYSGTQRFLGFVKLERKIKIMLRS